MRVTHTTFDHEAGDSRLGRGSGNRADSAAWHLMESSFYGSAEPHDTQLPDRSIAQPPQYVFREETIASLRELGTLLEPIYRRLRSQGYFIKDGILCKPGRPADLT